MKTGSVKVADVANKIIAYDIGPFSNRQTYHNKHFNYMTEDYQLFSDNEDCGVLNLKETREIHETQQQRGYGGIWHDIETDAETLDLDNVEFQINAIITEKITRFSKEPYYIIEVE